MYEVSSGKTLFSETLIKVFPKLRHDIKCEPGTMTLDRRAQPLIITVKLFGEFWVLLGAIN